MTGFATPAACLPRGSAVDVAIEADAPPLVGRSQPHPQSPRSDQSYNDRLGGTDQVGECASVPFLVVVGSWTTEGACRQVTSP